MCIISNRKYIKDEARFWWTPRQQTKMVRGRFTMRSNYFVDRIANLATIRKLYEQERVGLVTSSTAEEMIQRGKYLLLFSLEYYFTLSSFCFQILNCHLSQPWLFLQLCNLFIPLRLLLLALGRLFLHLFHKTHFSLLHLFQFSLESSQLLLILRFLPKKLRMLFLGGLHLLQFSLQPTNFFLVFVADLSNLFTRFRVLIFDTLQNLKAKEKLQLA